MDDYKRKIKQHNLRDTQPRRSVFTALVDSGSPLSIRELTEKCSQVNRTTIYRALETLVEIALVQIVPIGWKQKYTVASNIAPEKYFVHCSHCGRDMPVESPELRHAVEGISKQTNFTINVCAFTLSGTCENCK